MSIQPDSWIKRMCKEHNMIDPFLDHQVSEGKISYGLSSMGYDVRISDEYRIFTNVNTSLVDPKNFSDDNFIEKKGPYCIIPPNSFVLAKTIEYFRIPKDVLCICVGKCFINMITYHPNSMNLGDLTSHPVCKHSGANSHKRCGIIVKRF